MSKKLANDFQFAIFSLHNFSIYGSLFSSCIVLVIVTIVTTTRASRQGDTGAHTVISMWL